MPQLNKKIPDEQVLYFIRLLCKNSRMPFQLDDFQQKSIEFIEKEHSVFVAAPTGAGKTLIAERAIEKAMERGESAVYTAPIKALSNQKYRDFRARFGDDKVGILTGDVSINPDAPIMVMTTEIYRNSLFANHERIEKIGWVIFDEIHYLDDPERGTVWEEALLFTPENIRILALSATIPNVNQLAEWIRSIHNRPIAVIQEFHRPVPLYFIYQCQGRLFDDMKKLRAEGYFNRDNWQLTSREKYRGMRKMHPKPNRLPDLLEHLQGSKRLPAIYFAFGRKRTESLAWDCVTYDFLDDKERREVADLYDALMDRYDLRKEKSAQDLRDLVMLGIAYHHAGMLPSLKELVEQLFTSRLIKLIFTTETFALGINMPARTVIFDEIEKFYGAGFKPLTTRDFYQMAGRAGRRGMDEKGFVYVRIDPRDVTFPQVQKTIHGQTESVSSQFNAAYATVLNIYRSQGEKILSVYPKSFHYFQSSSQGREFGLRAIKDKLALLKEMEYCGNGTITAKGEFAASIFGYELPLAEMHNEGFLDTLDETGLNCLLGALIYEPRKDDQRPVRISPKCEKILRASEDFYRHIYRKETKYRVRPYTKAPCFNLSPAIEAWTRGASFEKLMELTEADEGEMVRYFRMVIQLLRELMHAPHTSDKLKATAGSAWHKINRGVVDAERQLRT